MWDAGSGVRGEERTAAYVCIYLKVVLGAMREGVVEEVERWGMERLQHRPNC